MIIVTGATGQLGRMIVEKLVGLVPPNLIELRMVFLLDAPPRGAGSSGCLSMNRTLSAELRNEGAAFLHPGDRVVSGGKRSRMRTQAEHRCRVLPDQRVQTISTPRRTSSSTKLAYTCVTTGEE